MNNYEKRLLTVSSLFFMYPGIFCLTHTIRLPLLPLGVLSILTSCISVNYWRDPKDGWRRQMDLIFAKCSFVVYFTTGILTIHNSFIRTAGLSTSALIVYCYHQSNTCWTARKEEWVFYHMAFHFFVACGQFIVITGETL